MRSFGLKTKTIFKSKNRFFHYEPLSASSFRKNLSPLGAIHFQKAKFLRPFEFGYLSFPTKPEPPVPETKKTVGFEVPTVLCFFLIKIGSARSEPDGTPLSSGDPPPAPKVIFTAYNSHGLNL